MSKSLWNSFKSQKGEHLEKSRLTENSQHGFRKGRSPWLTSRGEFFEDVTAGLGKELWCTIAGASWAQSNLTSSTVGLNGQGAEFVELGEIAHSDWLGPKAETKNDDLNDDFKILRVKSERGLQSAAGTWTGLKKRKKKNQKQRDTKPKQTEKHKKVRKAFYWFSRQWLRSPVLGK